jgi:cyanate permease
LAVIIIIVGAALSIFFGSHGYMLACAAAFFITPFGLLLGLLGAWKDKINEKAVIGIFLNIVLFVIGLFFNPISLIGGHNLH